MQTNFNEQDNTMVITTKNIMLGIKAVLLVSHDCEDGIWEFLEGENVDENMACIVSLAEVLAIDDSLTSLCDLPLGWVAYRSNRNAVWKRECIDN